MSIHFIGVRGRKTIALSLLAVFLSGPVFSGKVIWAVEGAMGGRNELQIGIKVGEAEIKTKTYHEVMKDLAKWGKNKNEEIKKETLNGLYKLILSEKSRLRDLGVSKGAIENYLNRLQLQIKFITGEKKESVAAGKSADRQIKIPKDFSSFEFNKEKVKVKRLKDIRYEIGSLAEQKKEEVSLISNPLEVKNAFASTNEYNLPVFADIKEDSEIKITDEIKDLTRELEYNPVKIANYVYNNIEYEPYFGAKKGAVGCLREKICNDYDGSSLLIALFRAANIPAKYKKSLAVLKVEDLQKLLGVSETKTVYLALSLNKVPVFTISGHDLPENIDEADFSQETHLAVQWVHPEIFYEYDERGANFPNTLDLSTATNNTELQNLLIPYPKKQWISTDGMMKKYENNPKEILAQTANFNSENFWYNYFQYQGSLSPINKYKQDLKNATNKEVDDNLSTKTVIEKQREILPITLSYVEGEADGYPIANFSAIDNNDRYKIRILLKKEDNGNVVFEKTFYGNEINNEELNLGYEGATDTDKAVIESYGGIHLTPVDLVNIVPYFEKNNEKTVGTTNIKIADALLLRFEYSVGSWNIDQDEKFSTAGNYEGIYLKLSKMINDPELSDNRMAVFKGNQGLAKKYLQRIEEEGINLKQSLDYEYNLNFSRAVVTQTRILNRMDGVPTTFDFKGYNLDASVYLNDWSNRGNYKNHQKDFRLIWGENSSYEEAQIFMDVSGLTGISTTKGLQYVYAHPESYTVKKITSANKNEIDTLELSDNTKNNMRADVDGGNTILTPNKMVDAETWHGLFYVSLDPEWTGTYAIGEQVATNGGWTVDQMEEACLVTTNSNICAATKDIGSDKFLFQDREKSYQSISCRISKTRFQTIKDSKYDYAKYPNEWQRWNENYGFPCMEICNESYCVQGAKQYGSVSHSYIFASTGTKFYSPDKYDYWIKDSEVKTVLERDKDKDKLDGKPSNIRLDGTFKFNPVAATYSEYGHGDYEGGSSLTAYYEPQQAVEGDYRGKGRIVYGAILNKLTEPHYNPGNICRSDDIYCEKYNWVLNMVGFPIANRKTAAQSGFGTTGQYQDFIGGQVYKKSSGQSNYVVQEIYNYYYGKNGTYGKFGFPESDPFYVGDILRQNFEGTRIDKKADGTVAHSPVWYKENGDNHFLIVELDPNLQDRACFKTQIGLESGLIQNNSRDFQAKDFAKLIKDQNSKLNGYNPIAALNGDIHYESTEAPTNINYTLGYDYSGYGNWTSLAISPDNIISFVREKNDAYKSNNYNVIGGILKLITNKEYEIAKGCETNKDPLQCTCESGFRRVIDWNDPKIINIARHYYHACSFVHDERTIAGITDNNYMIIAVMDDGPYKELKNIINTYSNNYGEVKDALLFDGGGSPAMMFDGEIKRKNNPIASALLIYTGEACNNY